MNFCTLFLKTENVHLMKDIGQIPFCLKRDFGYNAFVATYRNGEYPYLLNEVKGLELQFVKKTVFGSIIDGISFLIKRRNDIDILNVYHLNLSTFFWILFFKMVSGRKAITYLKLDANYLEISKIKQKNIRAIIKRIAINSADIVSCESTAIQAALQKYCKNPIIYIPNGYLEMRKEEKIYQKKENIFLTVGRLGTYAKATEILVDAFLQSDFESDWKLVLIGTMTKEFEMWLEKRLQSYPEAKKNILILGNIENKECLQEWYRKAKIFVLPSRYEGFPLVLIEALMNGCYIITTNVVLAAQDLLCNDGMGRFVMVDSQEELADALINASRLQMNWDENAIHIEKEIGDKFLWRNILKNLDSSIKSQVEGNKCAV